MGVTEAAGKAESWWTRPECAAHTALTAATARCHYSARICAAATVPVFAANTAPAPPLPPRPRRLVVSYLAPHVLYCAHIAISVARRRLRARRARLAAAP